MLILASAVTGCVSISAFALLVCVTVGITIPAVEMKTCAITAVIKKYKWNIKNNKKNDKIVPLGKENSNTIEVIFFKSLINSHISHDEFVSVNNDMKNLETSV